MSFKTGGVAALHPEYGEICDTGKENYIMDKCSGFE
jgi:hypothetical protein